MIYGHDKTIHRTKEVNVEVDEQGKVVSVWFRCMPLPFTQTVVDPDRANEMGLMYRCGVSRLVAVDIEDKPAPAIDQGEPR